MVIEKRVASFSFLSIFDEFGRVLDANDTPTTLRLVRLCGVGHLVLLANFLFTLFSLALHSRKSPFPVNWSNMQPEYINLHSPDVHIDTSFIPVYIVIMALHEDDSEWGLTSCYI